MRSCSARRTAVSSPSTLRTCSASCSPADKAPLMPHAASLATPKTRLASSVLTCCTCRVTTDSATDARHITGVSSSSSVATRPSDRRARSTSAAQRCSAGSFASVVCSLYKLSAQFRAHHSRERLFELALHDFNQRRRIQFQLRQGSFGEFTCRQGRRLAARLRPRTGRPPLDEPFAKPLAGRRGQVAVRTSKLRDTQRAKLNFVFRVQ